jgi:FAD synthase
MIALTACHHQHQQKQWHSHSVLTKDSRPTHLTLATLHRELNTHAMAQKTSLGGGNHGYLALLLSNADYAQLTPAAFVDPVYPGPNLVHLPTATVAQITETNRAYAAVMVAYNTFHEMENTIKNMLINAVPHTFIQILEDHCFGFSQVQTKAMLQPLDVTYGQVTIKDLANNLEAMNQPWDPATPIEELWTKIHKAKNYAANANAISDTTAVLSAV